MRLQPAAGWRSLLVSTLLCTGIWAKKDKPSVKSTSFDFIPYNVNYFEDSDVILFEDGISHSVYRSDDAGESWEVVDEGKGKVLEITMHPYDYSRAYIVTEERTHYLTTNRGKSWDKFETEASASIFREALTFHAGDPDSILFNGMDCAGIFCEEMTLYTTSHFNQSSFLRSDTAGCHWAKSSPEFGTGQKDLDASRIICVVRGRFSPFKKDFRLLISDNFFQKKGETVQEFEPELEHGRTVQGIVNMAVVKGYLIVAASAEGTDEMALYISDNSVKWHRAMFPHDHKLTESSYTVLEGTNYSIQIDIMNSRTSQPMGVFLSSNSNGTYFTRNMEHTNRNRWGLVDFEKVSGIQGIVLVNVVDNFEEVEKSNKHKKIISKISFDDGRTFNQLNVDKNELHLHSVTDLSNSGRVFSSPAPGLIMGIGNTGEYLKGYHEGDLFISDDAGLNWRKGLEGPHKYEFGDSGSILVAIEDAYTDELKYSLDHGKNWDKIKLEAKIRPVQLTTTQDSTSLKFLLEAVDNKDPDKSAKKGIIFAIDFEGLHESQCKSSDLEDWFARVDEDGKPACLMGHTQMYQRRKPDADCFMKNDFDEPKVITESCDCTDADFECDFNFVRSDDRKDCVLSKGASVIVPEGSCKTPDDKAKVSSGWRLIPGNDCKRTKGEQKDDPIERDCEKLEPGDAPASGEINAKENTFPGDHFQNVVYLERTGISTGDDETVLWRTENGVWVSHDHGKTNERILKDEKIYLIVPHPFFKDMVFFLTDTKKVFYSTERGKNIRSFEAPSPPNDEGHIIMNFHPKNKDWIIWIGGKDCPGSSCHSVASLTKDRGDGDWKTLQRYVRKCEFIKETDPNHLTTDDRSKGKNKEEIEKSRERLIYCETRTKESSERRDNPWRLVSSDNFFDDEPKVHFDDVVDFATMSEFIVVATNDPERDGLRVDASVDGQVFADAQFPHNFDTTHQKGYTVLDSSTHSVFLHVTKVPDRGLEYGTIVKSNSNGTSYIVALEAVDRDTDGYVDFEKMFGIEGVAMVNVVANYDDKNFKKDGKKLKTMITHNDGAEWEYLDPPEGEKWECTGSTSKCSLHIHGYTERADKSHTYSSESAIGLMLGTGNVGEYLSEYKDAYTFMTSDGGITWKVVKKGNFMWEFGDQGSIVVVVQEDAKTKVVHYSLDEGNTWTEHPFSKDEVSIIDMTTVPSDNSRNFLLWGKKGDSLVTFNLDFSGLTDKQCELDEEDVEAGDYYLWTPKHPQQDDDCLFGHVSQYHRKKIESKCYNGRMIPHLHDIARNCSCTRRDFECDFNYQRAVDGSCQLVSGLQPIDHSLMCDKDENLVEYYEPTGYRKIPLSTCQDGMEMDKSIAHPCSGKEEQFKKKHGTSGIAIFFAVIIPFLVAGGIGYWVWKNWTSKFGQIRLGEQSSFDGEASYIKYPVLVVAGVVAVAQALPLLASSLWRSANNAMGRGNSRRFTTRDSFARGRGDYAIVDEDEGELLGDDSDEDA